MKMWTAPSPLPRRCSRHEPTLTLLDDLFPTYDVSSRHAVWIEATPDQVYRIARQTDLGRPFLVRVLMGLRGLPAVFTTGIRTRKLELPDQKSVGRIPFTLIAEMPGQEFVLGIIGQFWTPSGRVVATGPEHFQHPPAAGLAQAVWTFRVSPCGVGTELTTETRVRCGDPRTRRLFLRYWRIIRLGSGLIRGSMLRSIRRKSEALR